MVTSLYLLGNIFTRKLSIANICNIGDSMKPLGRMKRIEKLVGYYIIMYSQKLDLASYHVYVTRSEDRIYYRLWIDLQYYLANHQSSIK